MGLESCSRVFTKGNFELMSSLGENTTASSEIDRFLLEGEVSTPDTLTIQLCGHLQSSASIASYTGCHESCPKHSPCHSPPSVAPRLANKIMKRPSPIWLPPTFPDLPPANECGSPLLKVCTKRGPDSVALGGIRPLGFSHAVQMVPICTFRSGTWLL